MHAMMLKKQGNKLEHVELPIPHISENEVLIKVHACGICRTDLHVIDGDLTNPRLPLIPGHQIIGTISEKGSNVSHLSIGQRVGVPWLGGSCNTCSYCLSRRENLCDKPKFTGYQINGGFAEYCSADASFCFDIPKIFSDIQAAPLLCAGLIGYRSLRKAEDAKKLGIYGFGAAAHILIQVANFQGREVYVFTRPKDISTQDFARKLGAKWAGGSDEVPSHLLDAAIIFAPVGDLVPLALRSICKGGTVVCGGIHMSDIPKFPYDILWGERKICSVANLTREDGIEFLEIAAKIPIKTKVNTYKLIHANEALDDLRNGNFTGAAVIEVN